MGDFAGYLPSILRLDRSSNVSFFNLVETGRGGVCNHCGPRPITPFPLTPTILGQYDWPESDIDAIVHSYWAPWPGYYVDPRTWSLLIEADGPEYTKMKMRPMDRPVAYIDEQQSDMFDLAEM